MFGEWFENNYILYACAGLCGLGFLIKFINNLVYWRLVKASENMSASKNKLVKEMKLKFETFYKLKIGVNNVDIFVDKYVYRQRSCGLLLSTWDNLGGLMFVLCLLTGLISSIYGVIIDCGIKMVLSTLFAGIASASILLIVDNLFQIPSKRNLIRVNIKDYLENYLKARLEQEASNPDGFVALRSELAAKEMKQISPKQIKKAAKLQQKKEKEQQKQIALEAKEKAKEDKKQVKYEHKQEIIDRKEAKKQQAEEEKRLALEEKEEAKRQALEMKKEKRMRKEEEKLLAERLRTEANEKIVLKRQESERRLGEEMRIHDELNQEQEAKLHQSQSELISGEKSQSNYSETAAGRENQGKYVSKAKERHDRLKEEIMANRELRNRELAGGKDPFETYQGKNEKAEPKTKPVDDFNMEYEMRVKAAKREEAKRKLSEAAVTKAQDSYDTVEQAHGAEERIALAKQVPEKKPSLVKGSTPYEDKVIDDILKEFLA